MANHHTPKLDRVPHFDERSREYPVRRLLGDARKYVPPNTTNIWPTLPPLPLDQGDEGACVGFAWAHLVAGEGFYHKPPVGARGEIGYPTDSWARILYANAQMIDRAEGRNWPEGASVLAGAKAVQNMGLIESYSWAFSIGEIVDTLINFGPVVLGIPWYYSMYETRADGLIDVDTDLVGGHAILACGFWADHPYHGDLIIVRNSWGGDYGYNGIAYLKLDDAARLMSNQGEACVPVPTDRWITVAGARPDAGQTYL